jgi:hypothetical protein
LQLRIHGNKLKSKLFKLLVKKGLFDLQAGIQGTWFSTKGIGYNVRLSRVIMNAEIIILDEFYPYSLKHIQILLRENILQTLVIRVYLTPVSNEVMKPCLEGMN